ncbi:MAG: RagB/SusD family nutrient uptake outer membrane protein [Candidatus Kapaibacterium sp.]|nr:MAG: RagB/SusD family nutrient uptake outer membrane protein [Candidatus Kapabacteria bacterium]
MTKLLFAKNVLEKYSITNILHTQDFMRLSQLYFLTALCTCAFFLASCQAYVRDVSSPVDLIDNRNLNTESALPLLYTAVGGTFAEGQRQISPLASVLSDECIPSNGISADNTNGTVFNIDDGNPDFTESLIGNAWISYGSVGKHVRVILEKVDIIRFTSDSTRRRALFTAYFFHGMAVHYLASYWGIAPRIGGGVLNGGAFIPSTPLHDTSLASFARALANVPSSYERRLVNTMIARVHLLEGRYNQALAAVLNGLQQGDRPFQATYTDGAYNFWADYNRPDPFGRGPVLPHPRFRAYVMAEAAEAARIPLVQGIRPVPGRTEPYFLQAKYVESSPIDIATWQENALMLAELRLRLENNTQAALVEVNRVRAAVPAPQGITPLAARTTTNLDSIFLEREKEFFGTGLRLLDQRRLNRWTQFTGANAARAWYFLPIPKREFDTNKNLIQP